jgi:hypothetical protein
MHAVSFKLQHSWRFALIGGCLVVATAACGSSPTTTTSAASPSPGASTGRAAYLSCLRTHGATVGKGKDDIPAAARTDCASLKPAGADHHKNVAVETFDTCMKAHGETIPAKQPDPTASPKPTGIARFLHGLSPDSTAVAAALKVCESDLPAAAVSG